MKTGLRTIEMVILDFPKQGSREMAMIVQQGLGQVRMTVEWLINLEYTFCDSAIRCSGITPSATDSMKAVMVLQ